MQKGSTDQGAQEKMGCESTRDAHASEPTPHRAAAAIPSGCSGTPYPWLPPTSGGFTAGSSQEQGNEAAKPKTGKVNSPDRKAEGLFLSKPQPRQRTSWVKDTGEPPNPPRNLPTLQTPNQPISPAPTEGQRRAANSDMGAGGLLGRKKGPAGTRRAARAKPPRQKAGPGGATGPISAPAPSVNSPFRLPDRPFGPLIRLQARPLRLPSAFLCPPLHSRSSLPRPRPPQEGVGLRLRVFRLRGWEMMIWCFVFSVLPLFLVLG